MNLEVKAGNEMYELASRFRDAGPDLIVFIHGLGCSKEAYDDAWNQTSLQPYSLLSFDLLGFGKSPRPDGFSYTVKSHAEVLDQILQQLTKYRIHLVANSWGPVIGLLLSDQTLNSLASFTNVEGRMLLEDLGNSRKAAELPFEEFTQTKFPEMKQKYAGDSQTAYRLDDTLPKAYYQGAKSLAETLSDDELLSKFIELSCPRLYLYGDQNKHLKSVSAVSQAGVSTAEVPDAGHFMMKDNPNEFYQLLSGFIAKADTHA